MLEWASGGRLPRIKRYAFEAMNVHRIHVDIEPENIASCQLVEKLGFYP